MCEQSYIPALMHNARCALELYETYSQEQVDMCIKAMCIAFRKYAQMLAEEAVEETGYGDAAVKKLKNEQTADAIWYTLKNEPSVGIIGEDNERKLIYVAKPVGVIAAVTPCTNPSTTIVFNACYALKGRNAVIFSPHPAAAKTSAHTIEVLNTALKEAGAPDGLLQYLEDANSQVSNELLQCCDLSVVAGNAKTVSRGYSSGKPSIGVSHGNVQSIVDRGYDYEQAIRESVYSCGFDNGLICACTQGVMVPEEDREQVISQFKKYGAHVLIEPEEIQKLRKLLFPDGIHFDRNHIGKSASLIAECIGVTLEKEENILLVVQDTYQADDPLLMGEMSPVCLLHTYHSFADAIELAARSLRLDGAGHSVSIYTHDKEKVTALALALPVTRLLVNQPPIYAANQQLCNGLVPTANLACGSWANNSFSENISYRHFLNICRITWQLEENAIPSHEEIWS